MVTPDPCALCGLAIITDEDRHVLHHHGGIRVFPSIPFHGWTFHEECFEIVLEAIKRKLREGAVREEELTH